MSRAAVPNRSNPRLECLETRLVLSASTGSDLAPLTLDVSSGSNSSALDVGGQIDPGQADEIRFEQARDLGAPLDSAVRTVFGHVDLDDPSQSLNLFRIQLDASQSLWQVGLEVQAQVLGNTELDALLKVYDARGQLIDEADKGRLGSPKDPYLFLGLEPGDYYVEVAASDRFALAFASTPSGLSETFQLLMVAEPATSTTLVAWEVEHRDPTSASPTGLQLQFDRPLNLDPDLSPQALTGMLADQVHVVDDQGRAWDLVATEYVEAEQIFRFLLRDVLPAGNYTVRIAEDSALRGLDGRSVVVKGSDDGTVCGFEVEETAPVLKGLDRHLGTFRPHPDWDTISVRTDVDAGRSEVYRFVAPVDGPYRLAIDSVTTETTFVIEGSNQSSQATLTVQPGDLTPEAFRLRPGEYTITLIAETDQPSEVEWTLSSPHSNAFNWEVGVFEGVGAGPGLDLRLIAPTTIDTGPTTVDAGPSGPTSSNLDPDHGTSGDAFLSATLFARDLPLSASNEIVGLRLNVDPVGRPELSGHPLQSVIASTGGRPVQTMPVAYQTNSIRQNLAPADRLLEDLTSKSGNSPEPVVPPPAPEVLLAQWSDLLGDEPNEQTTPSTSAGQTDDAAEPVGVSQQPTDATIEPEPVELAEPSEFLDWIRAQSDAILVDGLRSLMGEIDLDQRIADSGVVPDSNVNDGDQSSYESMGITIEHLSAEGLALLTMITLYERRRRERQRSEDPSGSTDPTRPTVTPA